MSLNLFLSNDLKFFTKLVIDLLLIKAVSVSHLLFRLKLLFHLNNYAFSLYSFCLLLTLYFYSKLILMLVIT